MIPKSAYGERNPKQGLARNVPGQIGAEDNPEYDDDYGEDDVLPEDAMDDVEEEGYHDYGDAKETESEKEVDSLDSGNVSEKEFYQEAASLVDAMDDFAIDAYRQYLRDISQYPLLTESEERAAFESLAALKPGSAEYTRIRDYIVNSNLRLVVYVAYTEFKKNTTKVMDIMDIIQEGNAGLMKSVELFDLKFNGRLSTYAIPWIRNYIQTGLANYGSEYRMTPNKHYKLRKTMAVKNNMIARLGREPTVAELAKETGFSARDVEEALRMATPYLSLNYEYSKTTHGGTESSISLLTLVADQQTSYIEDDYIAKEKSMTMTEIIRQYLTPQMQWVLMARFGEGGKRQRSFSAIGRAMGVTGQTVAKNISAAQFVIQTVLDWYNDRGAYPSKEELRREVRRRAKEFPNSSRPS